MATLPIAESLEPTARAAFSDQVFLAVRAMETERADHITAQLCGPSLDRLDRVFAELEAIHDHRRRYDLHWAFDNAQEQLAELSELARRWCPTRADCQDAVDEAVSEDLSELEALRERKVAKLRFAARAFSILSSLISSVDIVVSVALILVITQIAHVSDSFIESAAVALAVIALVAGVKVTLDRFYVIPWITRWGWGLYGATVRGFKSTIATMVAGAAVDRVLLADGVERPERRARFERLRASRKTSSAFAS
jgi:hypothetical protein